MATLLASGMVLVVGGFGDGAGQLASAELYDPAEGRWSKTGALATGRTAFAATLLSSGMVLVAGGYNNGAGYLSSAELYDPGTGIWRATGSLTMARTNHRATLLSSDTVLVTGGYDGESGPGRRRARSRRRASSTRRRCFPRAGSSPPAASAETLLRARSSTTRAGKSGSYRIEGVAPRERGGSGSECDNEWKNNRVEFH